MGRLASYRKTKRINLDKCNNNDTINKPTKAGQGGNKVSRAVRDIQRQKMLIKTMEQKQKNPKKAPSDTSVKKLNVLKENLNDHIKLVEGGNKRRNKFKSEEQQSAKNNKNNEDTIKKNIVVIGGGEEIVKVEESEELQKVNKMLNEIEEKMGLTKDTQNEKDNKKEKKTPKKDVYSLKIETKYQEGESFRDYNKRLKEETIAKMKDINKFHSRSKYFQVKEERKKKKKEEIKKEEKIDKLLDFDMLRDDVQFGERVDRPPIFTKLPKIKNRTMSQQRQFESVQLHYKQSKQLKKDKILQKIKSKDEETPSSFL